MYVGVSVDGFIAREDGGLDWLDRFNDPSLGDYGYAAFSQSVDTLVVGRARYDTVLGFGAWPWEGKRVVVFTNRALASRPEVVAASGALGPVLEALGGRGAKHVYLDGGRLVQQGLRERVVDSLTLSVMPLVLGAGRPLFTSGLPETALRLAGSQAWPNGIVQLRYERADAAGSSGPAAR